MNAPHSSRAGFLAITSALMIALLIVVLVASYGIVSYLTRAGISDSHIKEKSRSLADACVEMARLKLSYDSSYAGNETISIASDTCKIVSVAASGTQRVVKAQGQYNLSYTNYTVSVSATGSTVFSWEEKAK